MGSAQRLPNGNMVIHGRQEVRVNQEVRDLEIAGIIRFGLGFTLGGVKLGLCHRPLSATDPASGCQ